ncbi:uncharacterized protein V1518DRAFT_77613 [Limtongia smithiae]|uniref:uncharacterized protein n=1 Tax=Limtongia smithiae TaxID=1125753 RepID=UPI0034CEE066
MAIVILLILAGVAHAFFMYAHYATLIIRLHTSLPCCFSMTPIGVYNLSLALLIRRWTALTASRAQTHVGLTTYKACASHQNRMICTNVPMIAIMMRPVIRGLWSGI